jgi:protein-disulfide isomerase
MGCMQLHKLCNYYITIKYLNMPLRPPVSTKDHIQGNPEAIIELVEYGDSQCPYCGRAYPIIKIIQERLRDDLKFVFRHFPLSEIHEYAKTAVVAAEAAAKQGEFWLMHDIIFENQTSLSELALLGFAKMTGLDIKRFENVLNNEKLIQKVEEDFESGLLSGVNGTPTFFINGKKYTGSWEGKPFESYLKEKIVLS